LNGWTEINFEKTETVKKSSGWCGGGGQESRQKTTEFVKS